MGLRCKPASVLFRLATPLASETDQSVIDAFEFYTKVTSVATDGAKSMRKAALIMESAVRFNGNTSVKIRNLSTLRGSGDLVSKVINPLTGVIPHYKYSYPTYNLTY